MKFHQLELSDREAMQAVTLPSGRRNCNYAFANLAGWKFLFHTEVCVLENAVVLRYTFDGQRAYMVCTSEALSLELIEALFDDSNGSLILIGLEDSQVAQLSIFNSQLSINIEPVRNQYEYYYHSRCWQQRPLAYGHKAQDLISFEPVFPAERTIKPQGLTSEL